MARRDARPLGRKPAGFLFIEVNMTEKHGSSTWEQIAALLKSVAEIIRALAPLILSLHGK
jgi:hypothetical protein